MKNKREIKNLVVCAGAITIIGGAIAGGLVLYDSHFDHTKEICPFVKDLGVEHQINKIKEQSSYEVFTDASITFKKHEVNYKTVMKPCYEYDGYDYIDEYGTIAPNYVMEMKPEIIREDKYTPCTIIALEDEIVMVDPNKAEVVKTLKLK